MRANGFIEAIDEDKEADKYKVKFFWAKYCDVPHGRWISSRRSSRKWMFTRASSLVAMGDEQHAGRNRVALMGNRGLEALIRNVAELPRAGTGEDIAIRYGTDQGGTDAHLIVNSSLVGNKFRQCQMMGNLAPDVADRPVADEGWIAKPFHSIGGENIWHVGEHLFNPSTHYAQRFFDKVREYRAHVFLWTQPQVLLIQEKVIADPTQLCWNKRQGGAFRYVWQHKHPPTPEYQRLGERGIATITAIAVDACKRLHYDMGGVDIGKDANGNYKVFEVNARMGLREQTLLTYKEAFSHLKHIDIEEYVGGRWANG